MTGIVNKTTTQLYDASQLTGNEVLGIVQAGANKKTSIQAISYTTLHSPTNSVGIGVNSTVGINSIAIGNYTNATAAQSIAIGHYVSAADPNFERKIAIGSYTRACAPRAIAVGGHSYATNPYAMAIGNQVTSSGYGAITLGNYGFAGGNGAITVSSGLTANFANEGIAIGGFAYLSSSAIFSIVVGNFSSCDAQYSIGIGYHTYITAIRAIAMGYSAHCYGDVGTAIGSSASVNGKYGVAIGCSAAAVQGYAVAMGYLASAANTSSLAIGHNAQALGVRSVSLGYAATAASDYAVAIGSKATAIVGGTAIGWFSYAGNYAAGFGYHAQATSNFSIAIGCQVGASSDDGIAVGHHATAQYPHSIVLGTGSVDQAGGSFVVRGGSSGLLTPTSYDQKLFGTTIVSTSATAVIGNESFTILMTNDTPGVAGNDLFLGVLTVGNNIALSASVQGNTLFVFLATDSNGNSTTTVSQFAALFPGNGFTCGVEATDPSTTIVPEFFATNFSGGVDGVTALQLTSDGNDPIDSNQPAMAHRSIARITAEVLGYAANIATGGSGDSATFSLAPVIAIRDTGGLYSFVGEPTFTLDAHSIGAAGWDVPTLQTAEGNASIFVQVIGQAVNLDWLCFLRIESNV